MRIDKQVKPLARTPTEGKHETMGVDGTTSKVWTKVKSWFSYGLHMIADTQYEITVATHVTSASASEQVELRTMIQELLYNNMTK